MAESIEVDRSSFTHDFSTTYEMVALFCIPDSA